MKWIIILLVVLASCSNVKKVTENNYSKTDSLVSRFDSSLKVTITRSSGIVVVAPDSLTSRLHITQDSAASADSVITSYTESGSISIKLSYNRRTKQVDATATRKKQEVAVSNEKIEVEKNYHAENKKVSNTTQKTTTQKDKQPAIKQINALLLHLLIAGVLVAAFYLLFLWLRKKK